MYLQESMCVRAWADLAVGCVLVWVGGGYLASKDRDWDLEPSGCVCPSFPSKLSHGSSVESEVIAHFGENYFPKIDFWRLTEPSAAIDFSYVIKN